MVAIDACVEDSEKNTCATQTEAMGLRDTGLSRPLEPGCQPFWPAFQGRVCLNGMRE